MKTIELRGHLAAQFGDEFRMDVTSVAEAVRALCYQLDGFEKALEEGEYRVTRVYADGDDYALGEDEISLSLGRAVGVRIEPVVGGRKSGLGKLILGIVLVGLSFIAAPLLVGAAIGQTAGITIAGVSAAKIATIGTLMIVQGASALLTPTPQSPAVADSNASHLLDATGNLVEQGNAVPVVFGECFVGSVMISTGITAEEISIVPDDDDDPVLEPEADPEEPLVIEYPGP